MVSTPVSGKKYFQSKVLHIINIFNSDINNERTLNTCLYTHKVMQ